ncbi:hypothetical protein SAMN06295888_1323 [Desulfonatronum zhilinae]|nr:hypothetical protein SAMN06295888_1323 [Desulfonatronum zhilinae]
MAFLGQMPNAPLLIRLPGLHEQGIRLANGAVSFNVQKIAVEVRNSGFVSPANLDIFKARFLEQLAKRVTIVHPLVDFAGKPELANLVSIESSAWLSA